MIRYAFLFLVVPLLIACAADPSPTPDLVATQVAVEKAAHATLTAEAHTVPTHTTAPTVTVTQQPDTPTATAEPSPTPSAPPTLTQPPTFTPTERPPTLTPSPTHTPVPTFTPAPQPAVGDVVSCGDVYEISVGAPPSFAKELNVIDTLGYMTISDSAVAKGEWMLLYLTLTNLQSETSGLSYYGDELVVQGRLNGKWVTFQPSSWGTSRAQRAAGLSDWTDDVPPGITITAPAIFDVNPEAEEWTLVLQPEEGLDKACEARIRLEHMSSGAPMVTASGEVNLRSGPGKDYPKIGKTRSGQRFEIVGRNHKADWWQIPYNEQQAWIAASNVTITGTTDAVPEVKDIPPPPPPPPTRAPTATPTPFPKTRTDQEFVVQIWALRLYDVKKAKAVYFYGDAEIAKGTWLIPFLEVRNAGSGTAEPHKNLDFYLQDVQGRTYEFDPFNDAVLGAAWQFQAGHLYDDINPGLKLGIGLPFDVAPDLGDVWLRVEQEPGIALYLGNVAQLPEAE